jgi:Flp pilus assembly protein TadB
MGLHDRDWYQEEIKRKTGQPTGTSAQKSEFARLLADRDRKSGRPWWLAEWMRVAVFFGVIAVLYYAWTHFRG